MATGCKWIPTSCLGDTTNKPQSYMWELISCCHARGPFNPVCYCSLALFPSVPPSACISDECCGNVSWPGGNFHVCCARKERRMSGGRSCAAKWLRFSRISAPIHCNASGKTDRTGNVLHTDAGDTQTSQHHSGRWHTAHFLHLFYKIFSQKHINWPEQLLEYKKKNKKPLMPVRTKSSEKLISNWCQNILIHLRFPFI